MDGINSWCFRRWIFLSLFFNPSEDDAALLHDQEMAEGVKEINREVTKLAPVLNAKTTSGFALVSCDNENVPVDILTKYFDETDYLFAVSMLQLGKTTATFTIAKGNRSFEVIGENRTIEVTENRFSDDFADYAVHLYKVVE